jgi:hypothetical protein
MKTAFELNGYQIVKSAISKETATLLSTEFSIMRDVWFHDNDIDLNTVGFCNDTLVTKSFSWGSAFWSEALLLQMLGQVEKVTGKQLFPSYSYARIYYNGAEMPKHKDRPSCEFSVTLTLEVDQVPWEIYFKDYKNNIVPVTLNVGDMCIYKGDELEHWRINYQGNKQIQVFLHYVDQNGKYAEFKYDKRLMLGLPNDRPKS